MADLLTPKEAIEFGQAEPHPNVHRRAGHRCGMTAMRMSERVLLPSRTGHSTGMGRRKRPRLEVSASVGDSWRCSFESMRCRLGLDAPVTARWALFTAPSTRFPGVE
jgi:hypothetical protein